MKGTVYFDSILKTRSGRFIPYYEAAYHVDDIEDQKLVWFHEGYGVMRLYRVHRIDETDDFVAEDLRKQCLTSDEEWQKYSLNPSKALETI